MRFWHAGGSIIDKETGRYLTVTESVAIFKGLAAAVAELGAQTTSYLQRDARRTRRRRSRGRTLGALRRLDRLFSAPLDAIYTAVRP